MADNFLEKQYDSYKNKTGVDIQKMRLKKLRDAFRKKKNQTIDKENK